MAINTIQGFNPSTTEPIDSRIVKANSAARFSIPVFGAYNGLIVYQEDDTELYVLTDINNIGSSLGWKLLDSPVGNFTGSFSGSFTGSLLGTASFANTASFINSIGTNVFVQGGNSFGTQALLGTNDNNNLAFETSGSVRMFISSSGNISIGKITPNARLDVSGSIIISGSLVTSGSNNLNLIDGDTWLRSVVARGTSAVESAYPSDAPFLRASMRNDTEVDYGFIQAFSSVTNGTMPSGFQPLKIEGRYIIFAGGSDTSPGTDSAYFDRTGSFGIGNYSGQWIGSSILPPSLPAKFNVRLTSGSFNLDLIRAEVTSSLGLNTIFTVKNNGRVIISGSLDVTNGITGSLLGTASYATQALSASYVLNAISSSFASTASFVNPLNQNLTLVGNQTITGSLTITNNLTVLGSASIQFISESTLNIGTNLITVNTFTPSVRFGGLAVIDSGSSPLTSGSFLYDSVHDEFVFVHRGDGVNVTSSHFLVGPQTYNDLGNEIYIPNNTLLKSQGNEHVTGSNITDTGTLVNINSNTTVTGSLNVTQGITGSFTGSFTGNGSGLTNISASSIVGLNLSQIATGSITASVSTGNNSFILTSGSNELFIVKNNRQTIISGSLDVTGSINGLLVSRGNGNVVTNISIGATTNFSSSATGGNNFAAGNLALSNLTTGISNTAIGRESLQYNTTGSHNTAIGNYALRNNTTGNYNTAIGRYSLQNNTTGSHNTAVGGRSLRFNTTGFSNTAVGYRSLQQNTTGYFNTAIGRSALQNNTTGSDNTAIGSVALYKNTTGINNIAIGRSALVNNTTGSNNTAIGKYSLYQNITGTHNTAIGFSALLNNTTGNYNTAIGLNSLLSNTTGSNNIAFGQDSGRFIADGSTSNTTPSASIFIGRNTRALGNNQINQIVIGDRAIGLGSNTVVLGNTDVTTTALRGNVGIGTNTPNARLDVSGSSIITGSLTVTNGITGSLFGTSSFATQALSASFAPSTPTFPFTGSALITGSLGVTGSINGLLISRGNGNVATNISIGATTNFSSSATGVNNFAAGNNALSKNTTGNYNTAIGYRSLYANTAGIHNTAIGRSALLSNTAGNNNTAIGRDSLFNNTTGVYNTAIGNSALYYNTTGNYNTAIGFAVLRSNTTGTHNTAIGNSALRNNTTGAYNTAIGYRALYYNSTGTDNTAIGRQTLFYNTTGAYNTAIGKYALKYNITGQYNTAIGLNSLRANTIGNYNTAIGYNTLFSNTSGSFNTALGVNSLLYNTTGSNNTAIGLQSLQNNSTGNNNTAIGQQALFKNTTGINNTAIGYKALGGNIYSNHTGNHNTAIGNSALLNNTTGNYNTAIGKQALYNNYNGNNNTAIGQEALFSITSAYNNTAIGRYSLRQLGNGEDNIAFGYNSGRFIADGSTSNTRVTSSIFIGRNTRALGNNQINQIVIGDSAIGLGSNTVVLGDDSIITTALKGNVGIGTTTPSQLLEVNGAIMSRTAEPLFIMEDTSNVDNNAFYMGAYFDTTVPTSYGSVAINRNPASGVFRNTSRAASQINFESNNNYGAIRFYTANTNNTTPDLAVTITPQRNVLIASSSALLDEALARLHVRGSGATSSTIGLRIENSNGVASLLIRDDGQTSINGNTTITGSFTVITGSNVELQVLNTGVRIGNVSTDAHTVTGSLGVSGSVIISGSLTVTNGITGSLFGTASFATQALSASWAPSTGGGAAFPFTGSAQITGSLGVTGSVVGNVTALTISSNTASLNLNNNNFFTLQLVQGTNTHINPTNIKPGQTVNILVSTTGSATVSFPSTVLQISGSPYIPTPTTGKDIITMVSFDSSFVYLANVKNLI